MGIITETKEEDKREQEIEEKDPYIDKVYEALSILEWVVEKAHPTGLLPEQVGKHGEPISVLPLIWSHSTFVLTVFEYIKKTKEMKMMKSSNV